jgi:hypothetical protein
VSIVPLADGCRIVCNRDERRTRPAALAPRAVIIGDRSALFPIDPVSGGTWIGANDACLAFVLLNRGLDVPAAPVSRRQSRGIIIPPLLAHDRLFVAIEQAMAIDPTRFEPFRLIGLQDSGLIAITSDGRRLSRAVLPTENPLLFTSSSLGDARVEIPRSDLFDRMVVNSRCGFARAQHRFHRHRWLRRPEISVVMIRPDARTVSRTAIDVAAQTVTMRYESLDEPAPVIERRIACAA